METLPIDMNNPAVRDYLSLIRLQVLTPLSLLINIATVLVSSVVVHPSIAGVARLYPTNLSPKPAVIAAYLLVIYLGQLGYCLLLVFATKHDTKRTLVKGVGLALVFANWVMAAWAVAWVFQSFILSTVLLGILLLLLLYSNIALLIYHPPTSSRPLDTALIHAPLRFFLVLPLGLLFPYSLFIALGLSYTPESFPRHYTDHAWPAFAVVAGTNLLALTAVATRRDIVCAVAATWVCVSLWSERPKAAAVYITVILFTVLHPLALLASFLYTRLRPSQRGGRIALPPDHDAEIANGTQRGAREVDTDELFG